MTSGTSSRIRQPTSSHRTSPSGGIAETKKIADMVEAYYQTLVPHNIGSPVATVATAHTSVRRSRTSTASSTMPAKSSGGTTSSSVRTPRTAP
ncbi:enolase C-terminal domain-like protein [Halalkalicoccus salilacus]|uniref:enolase C-terminal domain-like protein n=1 Tax=Halalkalicoccus TaxID=332246 RepID=UPI002F96B1CD